MYHADLGVGLGEYIVYGLRKTVKVVGCSNKYIFDPARL